ncbi:MAG: hypothetical protein FWD73_13960 [Polyangiaceae bacterium]|nr:hypothetical protein [Polyangiaceae bacterium]
MKTYILFVPAVIVTSILACSSNSTTAADGPDGGSGYETASMTLALSGADFTGNSVRICGSRSAPDAKYRCTSTLTPCPCFNFAADGSLVDPATGMPAAIPDLCSSSDLPAANWTFQYEVFSALDCSGTQLNNGAHNFTCYDSHDVSTQAFPNQSANEVLNSGVNTNHVLCTSLNASKSWDFLSCVIATTPDEAAAGAKRYDCGCTLTPAGGTCTCGNGGLTVDDLETGCVFDLKTCDILCAGGGPITR